MWTRWLPWRFVVSRLARSQGFLDPVAVLSRLHRFAQPSEVAEPIELLRAGVVFHARGLLNARAIQHNLDWVWPFWVQRQFDPGNDAFVPRGFSATHVNLTHRSWTSVGLPDVDRHPIVDPHGLVTPLFDGWSLDSWLVPDDGPPLLPSRARDGDVEQRLHLEPELTVETRVRGEAGALVSRVDLTTGEGGPACRVRVAPHASGPGWLVLSLRPANPEGVSFVQRAAWNATERRLVVNDRAEVGISRSPDRVHMSEYRRGDALRAIHRDPPRTSVSCDVGLATAALLFRVDPDDEGPAEIEARVPVAEGSTAEPGARLEQLAGDRRPSAWSGVMSGSCELDVPDDGIRFLFDAAKRSLVLHAPGDVYPGPYTYKRFWFRDAAFILDALLAAGFPSRARRVLDRFPERQDRSGYFRSQEGEWDSNGAALWILDRYRRLTADELGAELVASVEAGARWIRKKRTDASLPAPHAGLLPAGFSAEHLGPNDFYYWDDFWGVAGLRAASRVLAATGDRKASVRYAREADGLLECVDRSLQRTGAERDGPGVPASPYRRMDAGAIGSLAADYPLRLWEPGDPRILATVEHLLEECSYDGGFFQEVTHSGVNAYLTLHLAQVLMRAGDPRFQDLVRTVARLASPTGQWPEAIHPRTGGGCMGDGQHVWAAAEWVLWTRDAFVREEGDRLVLASGILDEWLDAGSELRFGPTPTPYGPVIVTVQPEESGVRVAWDGRWRGTPPSLEVRLPGTDAMPARAVEGSVRVGRPVEVSGGGRPGR